MNEATRDRDNMCTNATSTKAHTSIIDVSHTAVSISRQREGEREREIAEFVGEHKHHDGDTAHWRDNFVVRCKWVCPPTLGGAQSHHMRPSGTHPAPSLSVGVERPTSRFDRLRMASPCRA